MSGYPRLVAVRLLPGVVGETKRVCHIAEVPQRVPEADSLTTYCGIQIWRDQAEILSVPQGMPCEPCLVRVPPPPISRAVRTGHTTGNDVLGGGNTAPELCPSTG